MKRIAMREGKFPSATVFTQVLQMSPGGLNIDEMRRRVRVLDALERQSGECLLLEDADHTVLRDAIAQFQFSVANRELLSVLDDVMSAETVSVSPDPAA